MNGTTRCPLCDTRFKITEAQLTAHRGMVRCGHCHGAFDARIDFIASQPEPAVFELQRIDEPQTTAQEISDAPATPQESVLQQEDDSIALADFVVDSNHAEQTAAAAEPVAAEPEPVSPEPVAAVAAEPVTAHEILPTTPEVVEPAVPFGHAAEPTPEIDAQIRHVVSLDDVKPSESPIATSIGFEPAKRRRWPWLIGIAACMLLLSAQSAYYLRVELAAHLPALRPALTGICNALGCKVGLPRDIDAISIESSGLDADPEHDNLITLNALLRNRAGTVQGYPMLVLTLNDNRDKLLARRWLTPAEYLPPSESAAAGFAPNHETGVSLHLDTADLKPSGYRLELFYGRN